MPDVKDLNFLETLCRSFLFSALTDSLPGIGLCGDVKKSLDAARRSACATTETKTATGLEAGATRFDAG